MDLVIRLTKDSRNLLLIPPASLTDSGNGFLNIIIKSTNEYDTVTGISFDYGQKHRVELERAQSLIDYLADNGHKVNYRQIKLDGSSRFTRFSIS